MAAPTPPRPRSSGGGTPLIMLGIVLAVIAAILVLYLTSGGSGGGASNAGGMVSVVVAAQSLTPGIVLSKDASSAGYLHVTDAFHVERLPAAAVPADAYLYTSNDDLIKTLDNQIIQSPFDVGDILRKPDNRMATIGSGSIKSVPNQNPAGLSDGQVLFALHAGGDAGLQIGVQEGDHIDLLATECVQASGRSGCQVAQTTLQDLVVYTVSNGGLIFLAVSHQDALILKILVETAKLDIVLRKPGDDGHVTTTPVDTGTIISRFGFTSP